MSINVDTCVAQHIGDRQEQQDRVALIPHPNRPGLLLAVLADGMGGHTGGAMAAEQVIHTARQSFNSFMLAETPRELLDSIINDAHLVVKLTRFTSEQDPHSTACLLLLQPGRVDWTHCGDSRIYHFRGEELVARSVDHSLVAELVRTGKLSPELAKAHPQRNMLISCLGAEHPPMIARGQAVPPQAGDTFLLCSDGLWTYFEDGELGNVLAGHSPRQAAELLIHRARVRGFGSGDNISIVIVKLTEKVIPDEDFAQLARR